MTNEILDQAQEMLVDLMDKLAEYKIPADDQALRFLECVLNHNGFRNVSINIESARTMLPIVTHAEADDGLFDLSIFRSLSHD